VQRSEEVYPLAGLRKVVAKNSVALERLRIGTFLLPFVRWTFQGKVNIQQDSISDGADVANE